MTLNLKKELLKAPGTQLDASMLPYIQKWEDIPKAIDILFVLDRCIHASLASGFVVALLQLQYNIALERENLRHEQLEPLAVWRDQI